MFNVHTVCMMLIERDSVRMTFKFSNVKDTHVWEREREREREREFSVTLCGVWTHIKCMYLREREERESTGSSRPWPSPPPQFSMEHWPPLQWLSVKAPIVSLHYFYWYPSVFFSKWQLPNWLIYEIFSKKRGAFKCQMSPFVLREFPTLIIQVW